MATYSASRKTVSFGLVRSTESLPAKGATHAGMPPDEPAPKEIGLELKIRPKKWNDFQHYKHRSPPWVKLQKSLLDDFDFQCLPVASRALAPMLWLVASESIDGVFDADPKKLAFRLRTSIDEMASAIKPLIDKGFFIVVQGASDMLASCLHDAMPETETETEKSKSRDRSQKRSEPAKAVSTLNISIWDNYSAAYFNKYGTEPVRNAKVNSQVSQLGKRLGEDAPLVAGWFLTHKNGWYAQKMHSLDVLLSDAEKLRTEWATGTQMTQAKARQVDKSTGSGNAFMKLLNEGWSPDEQN